MVGVEMNKYTEKFQFVDTKTGETYAAFLSIDTWELARQLAVEARRNKSRKSKLGAGAIVVEVRP